MVLFASLLLVAFITGAPFTMNTQARAAEHLACRPTQRDASGFGLSGRVGAGRLTLCGDVLLRVLAPPPKLPASGPAKPPVSKVLPKTPSAPVPVRPIIHPKGWVNRWASTIAVRPARVLLKVAAQHSSSKGLRVQLSANAGIHYRRGWLLGRAIVVRFTPSSVTWFVDHVRKTGSRTFLATLKLGQVHSAYVETTYSSTIRLAAMNTWRSQAGSIRVLSNRVWFGANTVRRKTPRTLRDWTTVFVNGDCQLDPSAFGC